MKIARRLVIVVVVAGLLAGLGLLASRWFPRAASEVAELPRVVLDSAETVAWRKANPWLFSDTALTEWREHMLLPFALGNGLGPRQLRRRGGFAELTFPRGRPIHVIAFEFEAHATRAGFRVIEGHELGNAADRVQYRLADAAGRTFDLRLLLGQTAAAGSYRMALVITELGRATAAERRAWAAFPVPVTLVLPDTLSAAAGDDMTAEILVELPMEPATYPTVKPGPRALFIDHSRDETEAILRARLKAQDGAVGFATKLGDRAIENPGLMDNVLAFVADRGLLFLDLTGSPRSLAPAAALRTGAEVFAATVQVPGAAAWLATELERRTVAARRSGEGVWVLRHAPGLPEALARVVRAQPEDAAPRWVTLRHLRQQD